MKTEIVSILILTAVSACSRDKDSNYEEFDRAHKNVTDPIEKYRSEKRNPNFKEDFDFSYIDKIYPNSLICFQGQYGASNGGIPSELAEGKKIVPGERYYHNGGSTIGIVTNDTIYTFKGPGPGIRSIKCTNYDSSINQKSIDFYGNCFYIRGAISKTSFEKLSLSGSLGENGLHVTATCHMYNRKKEL